MLELEHLQKSFDGVPVLKDISLQVEDGEIVSILGPSGCGKTTLLNMILGIVDADQGAIRYNGEDLTRTLVMKPRILLLDEPLSALDGVIKESIKDRIKTIAREYHLTTIIVTHDPEEALTLSDGCSSSTRGPSPSTPSRTRSSTSPRTTLCASSSSASWRSSGATSTPCSATALSWPVRPCEERRHETEKLGAEGDLLDHYPSVRGLPGRP